MKPSLSWSGQVLPWLRRAVPLAGMALLTLPAFAADAPSAREYLSQAAEAARQITLGGDQSAARRELTLTLLHLDLAAAREAAAGISRPSDSARALAAIAVALAPKEREPARQAAALGGRLLQRIVEPERRAQEYRLFLREIAPLGASAPDTVPELPTAEARVVVVAALAETNPEQALALSKTWDLRPPAADAAFAALAAHLAPAKPADALALLDSIASPDLRDRTLWALAEARPVTEAPALAARVQDPVLRAGLLTSAALRQVATDPAAALTAAGGVAVSPVSARAQLAAEWARLDEAKGVEAARQLPEPARAWALGQIALALAATQPEHAEGYLREAGGGAELTALVAARMAQADTARALQLARALPDADREVALTGLVRALAPGHASQANDLIREIQAPEWRDRALEAVARQLAVDNVDAATSLLGLVSDPAHLLAIRAQVAVVAAARDPAGAQHLLATMPAGETRTWCAFCAGVARLAAGKPSEAASLAGLGLTPSLATRWLMPEASRQVVAGTRELAGTVDDPYWRSLALTESARVLLGATPRPRPAPERARQLRPIVEWEGL